MGEVIISLLPLAIGSALGGPAWIIMTLILLRSENGVVKAAAFATGAILVRGLQFVLFGRVFGAAVSMEGAYGFDFIPSTLLLVAGVLLLITAAKAIGKGADPDAPPSKWMTSLGGVSVPTTFGIGVMMMVLATKQWVFTLSAIAIIDEAKLAKIDSVVAYICFIIFAQSLMLAPIIGCAISPTRSAKMVGIMLSWLERNKRGVTIVVSLIFGIWFLVKGMRGFTSHEGGMAITLPKIE